MQSWDSANKVTELSDYSVCPTWGLKSKKLYLVHVSRRRMDYPELKRQVREQAALYQAKVILIEDKASGTQLIQELVQEGVHGITRYAPKMDKVMRLHSVTSTMENGLMFLPEKAPWLEVYLHELVTFPGASSTIRPIRPPRRWTGPRSGGRSMASLSSGASRPARYGFGKGGWTRSGRWTKSTGPLGIVRRRARMSFASRSLHFPPDSHVGLDCLGWGSANGDDGE